jgi:hypothetical protein
MKTLKLRYFHRDIAKAEDTTLALFARKQEDDVNDGIIIPPGLRSDPA